MKEEKKQNSSMCTTVDDFMPEKARVLPAGISRYCALKKALENSSLENRTRLAFIGGRHSVGKSLHQLILSSEMNIPILAPSEKRVDFLQEGQSR